MEISGAVLRQSAAGSGVGIWRDAFLEPRVYASGSVAISGGKVKISARPSRGLFACGGSQSFADESHLRYYVSPAKCSGGKKNKDEEEKKRAKLVKGLSKDLSALCTMGMGIDIDAGEGLAFAGGAKEKTISEAAEVLLMHLNQLRAQEEEMKRRRKEEKAAKKAAKKASKMKVCAEDESLSSSSESSDSECEAVVQMNSLKTTTLPEAAKQEILELPATLPECNPDPPSQAVVVVAMPEENQICPSTAQECSRTCSSSRIPSSSGYCGNNTSVVAEKPMDRIEVCVAEKPMDRIEVCVTEKPMDRIEVCVGGKCKKSGALELIEEFERKIGTEGAVVGCKCMGKCKLGPNVRVLTHCNQEDSDNVSKDYPLCIGVGLEDVGNIVVKFFGENKDMGLMAA